MRNLLSVLGAVALLACGGDDGDQQRPDPPACAPVGTWTLITTFERGDCAELGEMVADTVVISDAGGVFAAELRLEDGTAIDCASDVGATCAVALDCVAQLVAEGATSEATASFAVQLDGDSASGTSSLTVTGDANCSSSGPVAGSR